MSALADLEAPLSVVLVLSESAARLDGLLEAAATTSDYHIVGAVASHPGSEAVERASDAGIPVETLDIEAFYDERDAPLEDRTVRRAYDEHLASALTALNPDIVACVGYRFVLTEPVLDRFAPRILSAHHADLTIRDEGEPLYPGLRAVRQALRDGRAKTHETVHVVTGEVDSGPPLVVSRPFPVNEELVGDAREREAEDVFDAYVYAHREWMRRVAGGPTLARTLSLLAEGRVRLSDDEVIVDGSPGPLRMGSESRPLASRH